MATLKKAPAKKASAKKAVKKTAVKKAPAKKTTKKTTTQKSHTQRSQNQKPQNQKPQSQDSLYSCLEAFDNATSYFAQGMSHAVVYLGEQWKDAKEEGKESFEDLKATICSEYEDLANDYKKWSKENPALATTLITTVFSVASAIVLRGLTKRG